MAEGDLVKGANVHYVRGTEGRCRPAQLLSDGITEVVKGARGEPLSYCHMAYYDVGDTKMEKHSFEVQRPHDALGGSDTWHLDSECPLRSRAWIGKGSRTSKDQPRQAP